MERVAVGLLGLGTVGSGVAQLLTEQADRIAERSRRRIDLKWVVVRDPAKARPVKLEHGAVVTDFARVLNDPEVQVVVEAIGGTDPALNVVLNALAAGKDVVTANKALLAEYGPEVFAQARKFGRSVSFEGSVGGGIPIVQALGVALAANQIQSLAAIVNGTCNTILTAMTREGCSYDTALSRQAQELGYAEADPTLDVDGTDTAHKLAILAQLAFGAGVKTSQIPRSGIDRLQPAGYPLRRRTGIYRQAARAQRKLSEAGLMLRAEGESRSNTGQERKTAGRREWTLQRHPCGGRRSGRHALLRSRRGDAADGLGGRRRPDRRRRRASRPNLPGPQPLGRTGASATPDTLRPSSESLLSPIHDRRSSGSPGRFSPDPRRTRHQHRERHPARPRRRCTGRQSRSPWS